MTLTEKIEQATHCYIGRKACGCVVAVQVDTGADCAKDICGFIRDGLSIERVPLPFVGKLGCIHKRAPDPNLIPLKDAMGPKPKPRKRSRR